MNRSVAKRRRNSLRVDVPDLYAALNDLLAQVPPGRVTTYGALARALGAVEAARWIATYLFGPGGAELPRHRVVLRDGRLADFRALDLNDKAALLKAEGVIVRGHAVDLARYGIDEFVSARPLSRLQRLQARIPSQLVLTAPESFPEFVGGLDVSYVPSDKGGPTAGVGAYALVHVESGELVWSATVRRTVRFPYVPGFLSFRELPILLELFGRVRAQDRLADVLMVDGNGILHHRQAGIASHLGVVLGVPTIGIGKSLLCGSADLSEMAPGELRPVVFQGKTVGQAMKGTLRGRPIFVSPGHRVDLPFAVELTRRLLRGRRVPEPIRCAHRLSREAVFG